MNNDRRKRIASLVSTCASAIEDLADTHSRIDELVGEFNVRLQGAKDDLQSDMEEIRDEEQEAYDNMSDSLQGGEKGQAMSEAIANLESAISELESVEDIGDVSLPDLSEVQRYLEQASE